MVCLSGMETKPIQPKPEIALRTLASDVTSLEAGNQSPVPKILTPDLSGTVNPDDEQPGTAPVKPGKTKQIVLLVVFLIIVAVGYFFIYPMVKEAFNPTIVQ